MLGDTAVAVHPDPAAALDKVEKELREKLAAAPAKEKGGIQAEIDAIGERRKTVLPQLFKLRNMANAGRKVMLPLVDREIPLIEDPWAKPELGSGCVKITPAHDANDYDVWQRHKEIGAINIMTPDGTLNDTVPEKYRGLKMHTKAREARGRRSEWRWACTIRKPTVKTAKSIWPTPIARKPRSSRTWPINGS